MIRDRIKDTIQDCNINFLIGSGLSLPYLKTLGNIESLLTELEKRDLKADTKKLIRVSLYKKYFDEVIAKNAQILTPDVDVNTVLNQYHIFLRALNSILLKRRVTLLSKEVNLFTTNIDIFFEKALEDLSLEYNDGFNGRFKPKFSLSNFKKSHFKKSLHYDNTAELPVFNLLKLHGSLSWEVEGKDVIFSCDLKHVKEVSSKEIESGDILTISTEATIDTLIADAKGKTLNASVDAFMDAYEKLLIVNPTKEKFKHTLMNQTYYELLRLYSNELEKENTVLFVMGFSFADEHLCEITLRAANSNPTLMIYVIAHTSKAEAEIRARFGENNIKNNNIVIIAPEQEEEETSGAKKDKFKYDFSTINKEIFEFVLQKVDSEDVPEEIQTTTSEANE